MKNKTLNVFFLFTDEVVNIVRGIGEMINEVAIVYKVLISLPLRFNAKVSSIKEMKHIKV